MKKTATLLTIAAAFFVAHGQGLDYIQNIVPQTPEANAILKSFETPVSLYTGSPDISVPIYTIKEGDINFNVKLSYNSTGITVGERASWVGLGWNLSVPTLIRNVRQLPDDLPQGFFYETQYPVSTVYNAVKVLSPDMTLNEAAQACPQCADIDSKYKSGQLDLESDDYRLTLPDGKSISFMVNQERDAQHPIGHIVQFPDSDYKVEYTSAGNWEVTNPQGFKYLFVRGNAINFSHVYTIGGTSIGTEPEKKDVAYTSAWVLSKITSPSNHILNFEYDPVIYEDCDLVNQTKTVSTANNDPNDPRNTVYSNYSKTRGTNFYISRIWGDFGEVLFNKDGRLDYTTYGKKLSNIEIKNKSGLVNKIGFDYDYMISTSPTPKYTCNRIENDDDISKRLRLKKVSFNVNTTNPISYQFNYNSLALPHRLSFARDWWGYYNGQDSNAGLTPSIDVVMTEDNKRDVKPNFAKAGVLEEIIYPTGGKTKFQFESNRGIFHDSNNEAAQKIHDIIPSVIQEQFFSTNEDTSTVLNKVYEHPLTINANEITSKGSQPIQIYTTTTKCTYPDDSLPLANSCSIYYTVLNNNNDVIIPKALLRNNYSRVLEIPRSQLTGGLKLKVEVYAGKDLSGTQVFDYNQDEATIQFSHKTIDPELATVTPLGTEIPLGGLRIKKIENYENTLNPVTKEYSYKDENGIESGISLFEMDFLQSVPGKLFVSSQSRFPMQTGNGSLISYTSATEYRVNPVTGERNNITHVFDNEYVWGSYTGSCVFNQNVGIQSLYSSSVPCFESPLNGKTLVSNYADKLQESYEYQNIFAAGKNLNRVYGMDYDRVIKPKDFLYVMDEGSQTYLGADFFYYNFKNFDEPDYSKETKEFLSGQQLVTKTEFNSLSPYHHQVTKQKTTADGVISETSYSYAQDKGNQLMTDKNMIGIPLETTTMQTIGGTPKTLSKSETVYPKTTAEITNNNSGLVMPLFILSHDIPNNTTDTEVKFDKYDVKGNLLQYTTKEGIPVAIVWGYHNTLPIAKVENMTYDALVSSGLISSIVSASDADATNPAQEGTLIAALDTFRNSSAVANTKITTMTYDPLIGVTTITSAQGIRGVYKYDAANRLEKVSDQEGKLLKEIYYHYKN